MSAQRPERPASPEAPEAAPTLGGPAPAPRPEPGRPPPGSVRDTARTEGAPDAPPPGRLLAERYTVLSLLGHGGMGLVLAAYDARLNRRVALKLLRSRWSADDSDDPQVRLLREAQAMARLNHPHVVHVYDSGRLEDESVFIAMEYVEGQTLRQWLQQRPRAWREVLRAFVEAGQGLSAAHAAGLVHRDFKPDNVLVGQDGRVRVTDFGVAQATQLMGGEAPGLARPPPRTWVEPLTESGKVLGTPRYMAPEQLRGGLIDARSDLFAFCVALYEALYGQRPFAGDTFTELLDARADERIIPPPTQSEVPAWVARATLRGLRADPLQRPGSMRELLAELQNDPQQRRRARARMAALAGGAALLGVAAVWGWVRQEEPVSTCATMSGRLAGIWDGALKTRLEGALVGTQLPHARDTFERVSRLLDTYAADWVTQRTEACEQARQDGAAGPLRLAVLREYCLERRLDQLGALTEVLTREPDPRLVDQGVQAVQSLPSLRDCADARALMSAVPPPEDLVVRARAEPLQRQVDRLGALLRAGRFKEGIALADALQPQLAALGHPPLHALALYTKAGLQDAAGDYRGAEASLREALPLAAQGRDSELEARAWNLLVTEVGARQARYADALALELPLMTAARRVGDDQHLAFALESMGNMRWMTGEYTQGLEYYQRALEALERAPNVDELGMTRLLNSLGNVLMDLGQHAKAREFYERSLVMKQELLGAEHPAIASTLNNLGIVDEELGDYVQAQARYEHALALRQKLLGPEHPQVASSLANLGDVLLARGQLDTALAHHERALALRQKALGPEHPGVAYSYSSLGEARASLGQDARAREAFERALAIHEKTQGAEHVETAEACVPLGRTLVRLGRWEEASLYLRRARLKGEQLLATDGRLLARSLLGMGELHLARGQSATAVPLLERALTLIDVRHRPEVQWALARALWDADLERARARELAAQAAEHYRRTGQERQHTAVAQWLVLHSQPLATQAP
ncbi:serine/threonine-protein kinase [Pyxidicoccus xibeiensis]|uniref:serine/threonine-protein kinase n=1 Tax=Pyxidicoccus xibeiensis TaxID=2906759 RepID=UPI0020A81FCC|nr:serine/threonine-protein kinase [Pyxidicoccus xibeiensis]MCP3141519.1 tetratricopeptide repeat protein [Pyxidicoccus xibeiensis]